MEVLLWGLLVPFLVLCGFAAYWVLADWRSGNRIVTLGMFTLLVAVTIVIGFVIDLAVEAERFTNFCNAAIQAQDGIPIKNKFGSCIGLSSDGTLFVVD